MAEVAVKANWSNPTQAGENFRSVIAPWCKQMWAAGHRLHVHVSLYDDAKTDRQRRYYHGVVLKSIAEQAKPNGTSYPLAVWKEYFRDKHLGFKRVTFTDPLSGKKSRRRVRLSTEDLGVRRYSQLIEQVTAFAVTELGVRFPSTYEEWEGIQVDPDTGEIVGGLSE